METINKNLFELTHCGDSMVDALFSDRPEDVKEYKKGRITFRKSEEGIYGTLQPQIIPETDGSPNGHQLEIITFSLYKEMFDFLSLYPGFQFVRIWNYVPLIVQNMDQSAPDIEVYRCFNAGRYKAFQERYGEDMEDWQIPAASAVGALDNFLSIEFFASDAPSLFFENKLQIPAYQYSLKYGKLPPVFSRGSVCELKNETLLFISGTASVVNEDTAFADNIVAQIKQTFKNIHMLINGSNLKGYGLDYEFGFDDLIFLRVYYKYEKDKALIESEVNKVAPDTCRISYVNTDICRKELVLEIEGICSKKTK
ncbi:MAG: hypothetical protein J7604_06870 [Sporocytophaga sp.]|uniref:chorismate transformation enzyme, FkbO/Hyg5 family n=1 Tax=Sporocytophaga TaxID=1011 RepID=UPI000426B9DF|nr:MULTISPECIES: hypothetical protein [Sporocytophaga]MBO9699915.1 hypothetical protein [Sporocytophaga sp.]